ncbi:MAG: radical SAM protein [Candidatus Riflebacteria bacterium]|nr:radical SAM protein [Candidatus Riflebacteria bacterium]
MQNLRNLEIHLTHCCNLSCESCSHYSNHEHTGHLSLDEADEWMSRWIRRVKPTTFSLAGGEPTLHPDLTKFIILSRKQWPDAHIQIITNGFLLNQHPDLPNVLSQVQNSSISISIHSNLPEYAERLFSIIDLLGKWVVKFGTRIKFRRSYNNWTRRYLGFGNSMEPFADGLMRQSWEKCPAKYCQQLFEGKIWKCAPLAYLHLQNKKFHISDKWNPYLAFQPLSPDSTDEMVAEFLRREEESCCNMCPANPAKFTPPLPF